MLWAFVPLVPRVSQGQRWFLLGMIHDHLAWGMRASSSTGVESGTVFQKGFIDKTEP